MTPTLWLLDDAPIIGGAEVFALRLGAFLAASDGPKMRIAAPAASGMRERCADAGIEWTAAEFPSLGPGGVPRWPGAIAGTRRLLRETHEGDIVIGNTARAQAFLFAASALPGSRPPIVHVIHELETLKRRTGPTAYRRADGLVAVGARAEEACRSRLSGKEVHRANVFADWEEIGPATAPPGAERPAIGVLGRLIPEKGQLQLVDELAQIEGAWSTAVLAGGREDEAYARAVEARVAELGLSERITLPGHLEDTASFFAGVDVLVFPSTGTEGQGLVIVEALAHGRPAVVRRNVFSPGDYEGLPVFSYEGADELRRALGALPGDAVPREQLRRRFGPEQALEAILAAAGEAG